MDDFSRKSWVILLRQKSDVEAKLEEWKALVEIEIEIGGEDGQV